MFGIRLIGNSLKIKLIQVFVIKLNTWVFRFGDSFFFYLLKKNTECIFYKTAIFIKKKSAKE